MKKVFVCSPLRAGTRLGMDENILNARKYCEFVVNNDCMPFAPHIYFTQFLDDIDELDRIIGIEMGLLWLKNCDEIWIFGDRETSGMQEEISFAIANDIDRVYVRDGKCIRAN